MHEVVVIPKCPGDVLPVTDFLGDDFNVDRTLRKWYSSLKSYGSRDTTSNEYMIQLQKQLVEYMSKLRETLNDLINSNYCQHLNILKNVRTLDGSLGGLSTQLKAWQSNDANISSSMTSRRDKFESKVRSLADLRSKRQLTITKLNFLKISSKMKSNLLMSANELDLLPLERSCDLFCSMKSVFRQFLEECDDMDNFSNTNNTNNLNSKIKHLNGSLTGELIDRLEKVVTHAFESSSVVTMRRCFSMIISIDKVDHFENFIQKGVIRQTLNGVIGHSDSKIVHDLYRTIISVVNNKFKIFIDALDLARFSSHSFRVMSNCIWPEIVAQLTVKRTSMFNAGNPDQFHANLEETKNFIGQLEALSVNHSDDFRRQSKSFKTFMGRWNLSVYFQIRFQEIGSKVERHMERFHDLNSLEPSVEVHDFQCVEPLLPYTPFLLSTRVVIESLVYSFTSKTYVDIIFHRFFKLALQIISRYDSAVSHFLKDMKFEQSAEKRAGTIKKLLNLKLDVHLLTEHALPKLCENIVVLRCVRSEANDHGAMAEENLVREAFMYGVTQLKAHSEPQIHSLLNSILIEKNEVLVNNILKMVDEVPRVYRRTNKPLTDQPSPYVNLMFGSTLHLVHTNIPYESHKLTLHEMNDILGVVASVKTLTSLYTARVRDVLESVFKMEESLRRLKMGRSSKSTSSVDQHGGGGSNNKEQMSDDDKIRMQLRTDVEYFIETLRVKFGVSRQEVDELDILWNVIDSVTCSLRK